MKPAYLCVPTILCLVIGAPALAEDQVRINPTDPQPTCLMCPGTYIPSSEIDGYARKALAEKPEAVWPFELLLAPRDAVSRVAEMSEAQREGLAEILQRVTRAYNNVFNTPFPYSMGLHGAPTDGEEHPEWQFHAHFYPPLLRSATIRKFMVGFELLGGPQRDITPESAAETLRQAAGRSV